jgi:hypothetical protein
VIRPTTSEAREDPSMAFDCPRCGSSVDDDLYGPCRSCRTELRATFAGERREVAAADYEPKMNVTPNQVATKE